MYFPTTHPAPIGESLGHTLEPRDSSWVGVADGHLLPGQAGLPADCQSTLHFLHFFNKRFDYFKSCNIMESAQRMEWSVTPIELVTARQPSPFHHARCFHVDSFSVRMDYAGLCGRDLAAESLLCTSQSFFRCAPRFALSSFNLCESSSFWNHCNSSILSHRSNPPHHWNYKKK